jgi:hypothetical protein
MLADDGLSNLVMVPALGMCQGTFARAVVNGEFAGEGDVIGDVDIGDSAGFD